MKKQLFFGLFAAVSMLCATMFTSCTEDEPTTSETTHIVLKKPAATTAVGEGTTILVTAVYDKNFNKIDDLSSTNDDAFKTQDTNGDYYEAFSLRLVKGQEYTIVCWAQSADCEAYNYDDLSNITIDYTKIAANSNAADAFFGSLTLTANGTIDETITLKRPFAQINLAVDSVDYNSAIKAGTTIEKSKVVVATAGSAFSALTGKVTATTTNVTFDWATLPTDSLHTQLNDKDTTLILLSSNFILPNTGSGEASALADVTFTLQTNGNPIEFVSTSTPLQHNYRTNVIGSLTNPAEFTIVIEDEWATPDYSADPEKPLSIYDLIKQGGAVTINEGDLIGGVLDFNGLAIDENLDLYVNANLTEIKLGGHTGDKTVAIEIKEGKKEPTFTIADNSNIHLYSRIVTEGVKCSLDGSKTFTLTSLEGLQWFADQLNKVIPKHPLVNDWGDGRFKGQTICLATDIDLSSVNNWQPIGSTEQHFSGIFDGKGHTISNVTINHNGVHVGFFANVPGTIKNLTLKNVNITGNGVVGAVAAYSGNIENCHVDGGKLVSTSEWEHVGGITGLCTADAGIATVKNCSVKHLTIVSANNAGGLVGAAVGATITDNVLEDITISVPAENAEAGKAEAGEVIGWSLSGSTETGTTIANVIVTRQ